MHGGRTLELLQSWATWSRLDARVGPEPVTGRSLESHHLPPQCWETPEVRETLFAADDAMRVARAVLATGVILAAAFRSFYIRQHPPRTRAQVQVLLEAQRRVAASLGAPGCATEPPERPRRRAADTGATVVLPATAALP